MRRIRAIPRPTVHDILQPVEELYFVSMFEREKARVPCMGEPSARSIRRSFQRIFFDEMELLFFLRNNTEAFKSKVENAQQSVALRLTEIKHGSRRLLFQIRLEIRGLFDGACKANRKVQPITEPENGDLKLSHPNQILTAHSSHLQQIQAIHNQFKSLTVNYK